MSPLYARRCTRTLEKQNSLQMNQVFYFACIGVGGPSFSRIVWNPLRKRLGSKLDLKMSKTGRMANSSLCEKCSLVKPRRGNRIQPRVSTLGCLPHQAARPKRSQERISPTRRFHRNNVMLLPIANLPPFNLPPFQGGSVSLGVLPGLKPWAESCYPFRDRPLRFGGSER
jgi:hypothetical protein